MKMKRIVVPRRPNAKTEMLTSIMPFSAWLEKPDEHRDAPGLDEVHRLEESIHSYARFVRPIKNKKRTLKESIKAIYRVSKKDFLIINSPLTRISDFIESQMKSRECKPPFLFCIKNQYAYKKVFTNQNEKLLIDFLSLVKRYKEDIINCNPIEYENEFENYKEIIQEFLNLKKTQKPYSCSLAVAKIIIENDFWQPLMPMYSFLIRAGEIHDRTGFLAGENIEKKFIKRERERAKKKRLRRNQKIREKSAIPNR
jgi:hypothetical protein